MLEVCSQNRKHQTSFVHLCPILQLFISSFVFRGRWHKTLVRWRHPQQKHHRPPDLRDLQYNTPVLPGTLKPQGYIKPCTAGKKHAVNAAEFVDFIYASEIFFFSFLTHEPSDVDDTDGALLLLDGQTCGVLKMLGNFNVFLANEH